MDSDHSRRWIVALVAAYAVALQALLSAFVPMAMPSSLDPLAMLCSHDADGAGGQSGKHDPFCAALCAAMSQGASGPLPPSMAAIAGPPQSFVEMAPFSGRGHPRIAWIDSHAPRGPPAV